MSLRDPASLVRYYADHHDDPDNRTSMADARIALCVARGVDLGDIDPATGYDCSRAAYDESRRSWVLHVKEWGLSEVYDRPHLDRAIANWTHRRPEFIAGDDWLTAATVAHHAYREEKGTPCPRESCDLHGDEDEGDDGGITVADFFGPGVYQPETDPVKIAASEERLNQIRDRLNRPAW